MRNALVIVIVCLSVSLLYDVYKEPIDWLLHLDQTETNETTETGNRKQKTKKQAQKPDGQQEEGLPSAYDGRMTGKAPEVKNQGTFGTCWAVVTSSALESRLLPQEDIIFSADHISTQNSYAIGQEEGGAYNIAIAYLTPWQGPVTEEMDPYGDGVTPEGLSPVKHVQEVRIAEDKDFDAIKEMIYRYGAVQSSIYMDMGGTKVTSEYYDPENTSYYYNGEDEVNHDILISTRITPMVNVESFGVPVIPCGPLMITSPPSMFSDMASFMEKWKPFASFPIKNTLIRFLMISPNARVTIAR